MEANGEAGRSPLNRVQGVRLPAGPAAGGGGGRGAGTQPLPPARRGGPMPSPPVGAAAAGAAGPSASHLSASGPARSSAVVRPSTGSATAAPKSARERPRTMEPMPMRPLASSAAAALVSSNCSDTSTSSNSNSGTSTGTAANNGTAPLELNDTAPVLALASSASSATPSPKPPARPPRPDRQGSAAVATPTPTPTPSSSASLSASASASASSSSPQAIGGTPPQTPPVKPSSVASARAQPSTPKVPSPTDEAPALATASGSSSNLPRPPPRRTLPRTPPNEDLGSSSSDLPASAGSSSPIPIAPPRRARSPPSSPSSDRELPTFKGSGTMRLPGKTATVFAAQPVRSLRRERSSSLSMLTNAFLDELKTAQDAGDEAAAAKVDADLATYASPSSTRSKPAHTSSGALAAAAAAAAVALSSSTAAAEVPLSTSPPQPSSPPSGRSVAGDVPLSTSPRDELILISPRNTAEKALDPVSELVMTERNFVFDLELLIELFIKPIRGREILPARVAQEMFINVEYLVAFHRHLYQQLNEDSSPLGITRAFSPEMLVELEQLYTVYMGHYEKALELYYERRESAAQFRKFLKQCSEFNEKSINNLLVTPMQRVCKYELMLKSIIRWHRKSAKKSGVVDAQLVQHCRLLRIRIDELSAILQSVDRKRAAADRWETVCKLEQSLLVSEALAKVGRFLVLQSEFAMRVFDSVHGSSSDTVSYSLVLFNDLLLRTKLPRKGKRARVLDSVPLTQVYLIDTDDSNSTSTSTTTATGAVTFYIVNSDPRGAFWELTCASKALRDEWLEKARAYVPNMSRFNEQWHLEPEETLLAADTCQWPQAYVSDCRLYVTSNHLCISWKMFGSSEREVIPLTCVKSVKRRSPKSAKDLDANQIEIVTDTWRQSYTFTALLNGDHTFRVLDGAIQFLRARSFLVSKQTTASNAAVKRDSPDDDADGISFRSFLMDDDSWTDLWASGSTLEIEEGKALVMAGKPTNALYLVLDGTMTIDDKNDTRVSVAKPGDLVGCFSFLDGRPSRFTARGGPNATRLQVLERQYLMQNLAPEQLASFFASLAHKLSYL